MTAPTPDEIREQRYRRIAKEHRAEELAMPASPDAITADAIDLTNRVRRTAAKYRKRTRRWDADRRVIYLEELERLRTAVGALATLAEDHDSIDQELKGL